MKNQRLWLGILVMALVFSFIIIGCDLDDLSDFGNSSITISGNPKVGETLTVTFQGDFSFTNTYWEFSEFPDSTKWRYYILDLNKPSLTLDKRYLGYYIRVSRFLADYSEDIYSNVIGPVQP
jgi:hypothetical protein